MFVLVPDSPPAHRDLHFLWTQTALHFLWTGLLFQRWCQHLVTGPDTDHWEDPSHFQDSHMKQLRGKKNPNDLDLWDTFTPLPQLEDKHILCMQERWACSKEIWRSSLKTKQLWSEEIPTLLSCPVFVNRLPAFQTECFYSDGSHFGSF